jgi:enoyl-CoA hydratase
MKYAGRRENNVCIHGGGVAMGGGFEIALACDIIVASAGARFALPEPKVGLAPGGNVMHAPPCILH